MGVIPLQVGVFSSQSGVIFVYEMSIFSMKNVHFTVCVFKNERIKSHFVYVMTYDSCILLFKNERIKSRFLMLNI